MTRPPDNPVAAKELTVALRAHALCAASEPHRGRFQTCPCERHRIEALRQFEAAELLSRK